MSEGGDAGNASSPKLYAHKPRKAQLKQFRGQQKPKEFSSPPVMGTQTATIPPPPPPPKESFIRRYRFLWPMLLAVNLGVGIYVFARTSTKKKDTVEEEKDAANQIPANGTANLISANGTSTPISVKDALALLAEQSVSPPSYTNPAIKREPIPEGQQRELFKWILEERRKIKPKDEEEKKRIEEEKALLKNLIRSKSIPSI
ncbi:uncharacterized protein LOC131623328 [Vicia villosa]|uniref:uncharacterized protein LOC131623328 n=1 Tax=Vicia villosa TaxID=3911 RepID=UPI00273B9A6C|nr:uncharacterized protein LOC131623328 [Vicia villosa]